MNWQIWVVPVIALAVWILLQMRAPDAPPQPPRQRPLEGDRPRQPTGDVGRFLEEIERLRRQSAPERREPPPMAETAPAESASPAVFERPSPPPPPPRPRVEKPKVKKPRPVPVTVVAPAATLPILDVLPADPPRPQAAPTVAAPQKPRRVAPATAQLLSLLQTPGSLQTAILLQEVLGPPRCRRKR